MLFARFEFDPEYAEEFLDSRCQTTSEVVFEDEDDFMECIRGVGQYLTGCTVLFSKLGKPRRKLPLRSPISRKQYNRMVEYLEEVYNTSQTTEAADYQE
jgi:hypothetical protein